MKIHKSKIERPSDFSMENLELGQVRITMKGKDPERIWVRKDPENKVMYLANHAVMFYPMPSWGMELPLCDEIDLHPYRGDKYEETEFTVIEETFENLKDFISEDDTFDVKAYMELFKDEYNALAKKEWKDLEDEQKKLEDSKKDLEGMNKELEDQQ